MNMLCVSGGLELMLCIMIINPDISASRVMVAGLSGYEESMGMFKRNFHQIDNRLLPASASHHFMVWRHDSIMACAWMCAFDVSGSWPFPLGLVVRISALSLSQLLPCHRGYRSGLAFMIHNLPLFIWRELMALAIFFVGLFAFRHLSGLIMMLLLSVLGLSLIAFWRMDQGGVWLVIGLITVALVDTMGYLVGRKIGGAKLWPAISPAKTWSGAIGGMAFSPVPILIYLYLNGQDITLALFGLALGIMAIAGDLLESWYKRSHELKDIGWILPGHGGLLDRFDGSLLTIPALFSPVHGWLG